MICDPWTLVAVRVTPTGELHPAVVLSTREFNQTGSTILTQIVSARLPHAEGDIPLAAGTAGLAKDSVIRLKLFALSNESIDKRLGDLPEPVGQQLGNQIFSALRLG